MTGLYVNYGCGNNAPEEWTNFDASYTLIFERLFPFKKQRIFPANVKYGNIVKGLPIKDNSCNGVYCSHVLEHLSFFDFIVALKNTYRILKKAGIFRIIMPDLEDYINIYIKQKVDGEKLAAQMFIEQTLLGVKKRPKSVFDIVKNYYGNSKHLWLWDKEATIYYLKKYGFKNINEVYYGEYSDDMFSKVDIKSRYNNSFCLEMTK